MAQLHEGGDLTALQKSQLGARSFRDVAEDFMTDLETPRIDRDAREPITIRGYRSLLDEHILPHIEFKGGATADGVNLSSLKYLVEAMYAKGASYDRTNKALKLTRQILKWAVQQEVRLVPVPDMVLEKPASVRAEEQDRAEEVYTPDQIYTLLRAADSLAEDRHAGTRRAWITYRPLAYFIAETGVRISEARGFPVCDFDAAKGVVRIRQTADENGRIKRPKSLAGRRDIPLSAALRSVMEKYLEKAPYELAFASEEGTPRSIANLHNRMLKKWVARASELAAQSDDSRLTSVENWGFHAIRHAYASRLISAGANLKQLQVYMGHHDPAFTMRVYGHLFPDDAAAVMEKMAL
ncbi:tyrosine-type recombinase/integrase [Sulfitobacter dubius]|uniref:tyrosine-type recombinase/integrase n=1 Tax=Sulfitobacter dubius TaxID=218673 RepID=UPI002943C39E|nr:site-specific integrase [Sulfitobacter dubius]WOI29133.1 site-specific integrase [Sulfitobacter dubius]